ncbi:MAG: di-heme oxidoredictase family protein [Oleispira sp.]
MRVFLLIISALTCLTACEQSTHSLSKIDLILTDYTKLSAPAFNSTESKPGGETSVSDMPFPSFQRPSANLDTALKPNFHAGKALANQPWVKAPTITDARDGLGPIYNARTCLSCHVKGGKGSIPIDNKLALSSTLVRLSKPGNDHNKLTTDGVIPHPVYGDQMQGQSVSLAHQLRHSQKPGALQHDVAPEAYIYVHWDKQIFTYPDQQQVELRKPRLEFTNLGYGPLGDDTLFSIRVAPAIHGMGLLELIAEQDLQIISDEDDANSDGISGRLNQVWDVEKQATVAGRFGLKANKPTLKMIVAGAFKNDLGISNPLFPDQPCTNNQPSCLAIRNGNTKRHGNVELSDSLLTLTSNFNRDLAPVIRRNSQNKHVMQGRTLFYQVGCNQCHVPRFITQKSDVAPHLSEQIIWPYTDLLLHDMGPELADGRPDFLASGYEWRTAPLWGVGLLQQVNGSNTLLHDGRARSVEEAVLWHGGEANTAKARFIQLKKSERTALIKFVNSL